MDDLEVPRRTNEFADRSTGSSEHEGTLGDAAFEQFASRT
jgi:hypothetical protein